jgi:cardiolipin synthase (CMP-forming)
MRVTGKSKMLFLIPFFFTLLRVLLIPLLCISAYHHHWSKALILFAIACTTDFFDGWTARYYRVETLWGGIFDACADKLLIFFCMVMLTQHSSGTVHYVVIPYWFASFFVTKELIQCVGSVYYCIQRKMGSGATLNFCPTFLSKWTTTLLMLYLCAIFFLNMMDCTQWYHQWSVTLCAGGISLLLGATLLHYGITKLLLK